MRLGVTFILFGVVAGAFAGCGKEEPRKGYVAPGDAGSAGVPSATGGATPAGAPGSGGAHAGGAGGLGASPSAGVAGVAGADGGAGGGAGAPSGGGSCTDIGDCELGEVCYVGLGGPAGTCRRACPVAFAGEQGPCAPTEVCAESADGLVGGCLATCAPYAGGEECEAPDWCEPYPNAALTGGTSQPGLCVSPAGTVGDGESCATAACAPGLGCYDQAYDTVGAPHCEPFCDPTATAGLGTCGVDEICRPLNDPARGVCLQLCDPFVTGSCPPSEACAAFDLWNGAEEIVEGQCVQAGEAQEGDPCTALECGDGLVCTGFGGGSRRCRVACSTGSPDCAAGDCAPVLNDSLELGACMPPCTPYAEGTAAGCENGEWCAPSAVAGIPTCIPAGTALLGQTCESHEDCGVGDFCECQFGAQSFCYGAGVQQTCDQRCDPAAGVGELGACAPGQACVPKAQQGALLPYGVCREACDYDGAGTCTNGSETCVPGEVIAATQDACMDVPAAAPAPGAFCGAPLLDYLDPCSATALCRVSELNGDPECVPVCRTSEGALGTTNHPDCATATATCTQIAAGLSYGRCVEQPE